jgi:hypothetical protein
MKYTIKKSPLIKKVIKKMNILGSRPFMGLQGWATNTEIRKLSESRK